jgi:hypothetical protein
MRYLAVSSRIRRFRTVIRVFVSIFCPSAAASAYLSLSAFSSSLEPESGSPSLPSAFACLGYLTHSSHVRRHLFIDFHLAEALLLNLDRLLLLVYFLVFSGVLSAPSIAFHIIARCFIRGDVLLGVLCALFTWPLEAVLSRVGHHSKSGSGIVHKQSADIKSDSAAVVRRLKFRNPPSGKGPERDYRS